jgi:hypothetical protein
MVEVSIPELHSFTMLSLRIYYVQLLLYLLGIILLMPETIILFQILNLVNLIVTVAIGIYGVHVCWTKGGFKHLN